MMNTPNLHNPVISAVIWSQKGNKMDLTSWNLNNSHPSETPSGSSSINHPLLESVSVTLSGQGQMTSVEASISGPYDYMNTLIEKNLEFFAFRSALSVQLGYAGGSAKGLWETEEFWGILQPPQISPGETTSVELTAKPSANLDMVEREKGRTYENTQIFQILRDLADDYSLSLYRLNTKGEEVEVNFGNVPDPLREEVNNFTVSHGDFATLHDLTELSGLDFYVRNDRIVLLDYKDMAQSDQGFVFAYREKPDLENHVYPISDFSPESEKHVTAAAGEIIKSKQIDLDSKEKKSTEKTKQDATDRYPQDSLIESEDNQTDHYIEGGLARKMIKPGLSPTQAGSFAHIDPEDEMAEQKVTRRKIEELDVGGVKASFDTIGIPLLKPSMKVRVRGVTPLYEGEYFIRTMTHTGDSSGWSTSIEGHSITKSERTQTKEEPENKRKKTNPLEEAGGKKVKDAVDPTSGTGFA